MNRLKTVSLVLLYLMLPYAVFADGMMFMDAEAVKAAKEKMQHMLINEPEQKAVIFFDKGEEQLIISPSYDGAPEKFAWVVPVPSKPKVEMADIAVFYELMDITTPILKSAGPSKPEEPTVKVLERKTVGKYDVSVLSSTDGSALMDWLTSNGYHIPEKALEPIRDYVKRRWTFVASKVIDTEPGTVEGLKNGTLSPLKLTFRSARPVYPLKLSSVNPEPFDLHVYIVMPLRHDRYTTVLAEKNPPRAYTPEQGWGGWYQSVMLQEDREHYPLLSKFHKHELAIYEGAYTWASQKVKPEECKRDLYWNILRIQHEPVSFISYGDYIDCLVEVLNRIYEPFKWSYDVVLTSNANIYADELQIWIVHPNIEELSVKSPRFLAWLER